LALVALFIPALAHAHTHGSFDHPWHDRVRDVFMLTLAAVAVVSGVSVFICGSARQRIVAVAAAALPVYMLVHFLAWATGLF
jgi:hypothetical protein